MFIEVTRVNSIPELVSINVGHITAIKPVQDGSCQIDTTDDYFHVADSYSDVKRMVQNTDIFEQVTMLQAAMLQMNTQLRVAREDIILLEEGFSEAIDRLESAVFKKPE